VNLEANTIDVIVGRVYCETLDVRREPLFLLLFLRGQLVLATRQHMLFGGAEVRIPSLLQIRKSIAKR
jgi:hypothetical protein